MPSSDDFARFAFDGIGLVPVSPDVEHRLMTTRTGKAFVRHSVHRSAFDDWDLDPIRSPPQRGGWTVGGYAIPDNLRPRCPGPHLLVAKNERGEIVVMFTTDQVGSQIA